MTTTSTTPTIRSRREQLGISRLRLAVQAGVSPAWLAALEAGVHPASSPALARVQAALTQLAADPELLKRQAPAGFRLEPGIGVSGYRGDHDRPQAA